MEPTKPKTMEERLQEVTKPLNNLTCIGHYVAITAKCESCPIEEKNQLCEHYKRCDR